MLSLKFSFGNNEGRLSVWMLKLDHVTHTIFFDYICDEVEKMTALGLFVANI